MLNYIFLFQNLLLLPLWAINIGLFFYIGYQANQDPNVLNERPTSLILLFTFFSSWDMLAFVIPAIFFAGKPGRRRNFKKWTRELVGNFKTI